MKPPKPGKRLTILKRNPMFALLATTLTNLKRNHMPSRKNKMTRARAPQFREDSLPPNRRHQLLWVCPPRLISTPIGSSSSRRRRVGPPSPAAPAERPEVACPTSRILTRPAARRRLSLLRQPRQLPSIWGISEFAGEERSALF